MLVRRFSSAFVAIVAAMTMVGLSAHQAVAVDEAVAASGPALNVALFVNSSPLLCYNSGHIRATEKLAKLAVERINKFGGIRGRTIELTIYDNEGDAKKAVDNVHLALKKKDLLALIGLSDTRRAEAVFKIVDEASKKPSGTDKTAVSKIPFISNITVGKTLEKYDNVFSTRPAQEVERVPVMARFFKANGIKTISFLGRTERPWVGAIGSGLRFEFANKEIDVEILSDHRVDVLGTGKLNDQQLDAAIAEIERVKPQMLVVSVGTTLTDDVMRRLQKATIQPPIFMVGWLSKGLIDPDPSKRYKQPVFGIDWATVPEVESDRLFNILGQGEQEKWFFAGRTAASVSVWKKNDCDNFHKDYVPSTFSAANVAAAKEGALFADMIKLIATSAGRTGTTLDIGGTHNRQMTSIAEYRKAILKDLSFKYAAGRGAFTGIFENWSFHRIERVRAQTPIVVILPHTLGRKQLASTQFVRLREGGLKKIETLYLDIDLIRTHSVDNNKKSFFAEFYVAMRKSDGLSIEDITFANAFLDPRASRDRLTNGRELSIDVLHPGGKSDAYPKEMQIYKVSGRFRFKPDFTQYPFDTQQFSIDLQPRNSNKTFIIQPPPADLRDTVVATEGWIPDKQYVSYVEDFVPIVDAFTHTPSVVPFYNARFVWTMKREATDYYIRVVVPLAFILIVAYLSIFIPKSNLEAIVTIQITALLAAVALYLSLPQIDTDSATISDQIFMFDYMMVSIMIIVSILRINALFMKFPWINTTLNFVHIILIPAVLVGLVLYITKSSLLQAFLDNPTWKLLGVG